jgi:hypothetical protein
MCPYSRYRFTADRGRYYAEPNRRLSYMGVRYNGNGFTMLEACISEASKHVKPIVQELRSAQVRERLLIAKHEAPNVQDVIVCLA